MSGQVIAWLLAPLSGAHEHHVPGWVAWHGRAMVFGWGILLPLGALAARYFKVTPGQNWPAQTDNRTWWHLHRACQYLGVLAMTLGLGLAFGRTTGGAHGVAGVHRAMGWGVLTAGWLMMASGIMRGSKGGPTARGAHYDMTRHRKMFEVFHKTLGAAALLTSTIVIALGLVTADAPRWMAVVLAVWALLLLSLAIRWQRAGRCIDTYQAIWGPDPVHPGNRLKPIGFGIRRYTRETWQRRFGRHAAKGTSPSPGSGSLRVKRR